MNNNNENLFMREIEAKRLLWPLGFYAQGNFRFLKNGVLYDLSAADLSQIERIEREGLFVVNN